MPDPSGFAPRTRRPSPERRRQGLTGAGLQLWHLRLPRHRADDPGASGGTLHVRWGGALLGAGRTPLRALETRKPRWSPNVSFTVSLAWALVAIMGVPALAIATWGLAGGYSFKYLPFLLVPYAIPFAVAPLLAVLLIQWPRRLRAFSVPAGVLVAVLALGASAIAVLA